MKIYSENTSGEPIDFIVERVLRAYIAKSGTYAIVTVGDDNRNFSVLSEELEIENLEDKHFSIFFSPTQLVCGMDYILSTNEERELYSKIVKNFKQSFYDSVINYYENGGIINRAAAIRLIWNDFNSGVSKAYDNVNNTEVEELIKAVDKKYVENRITEKFVELIIKYAIYLTMWEQRYSAHEANKMLGLRVEKNCERGIEQQLPDIKTVRKSFVFLFTGETEMKRVKDSEYIILELSANGMKRSSEQIQDKIYNTLNIYKDEGIDIHNRFFITPKKEKNVVYTSLLGQLLFVNYLDFRFLNNKKKMEFFLEDDFVGDISAAIEQVLETSIEIVLMMNMFINGVDLENIAKHPFVKKTMELHTDVLPVVKYFMALEEWEGNVRAGLEEIDNKPELKRKIMNSTKEKIKKMKDEDYGAVLLGGYYMFASPDEKIITGTSYSNVRARAKRKEKDYWEKRYQCLKKWEFSDKYQANTELVAFFMKYLKVQNQEIHSKIKEILGVYIK